MDKKSKTTPPVEAAKEPVKKPTPPEKLSVEKQYLEFRLNELIKQHQGIFNEYNYLLSVLHPPEVAAKG